MKDRKTLEVRVASAVNLEALVSLATAFRDHVGLSVPLEADFRTAIARLLQDQDTEFLVAWSTCGGTSLGYGQSRYRWARDAIPHSWDVQTDVIICSASEVLEQRTGLCSAKSHLQGKRSHGTQHLFHHPS
jgi:hypothetical protein